MATFSSQNRGYSRSQENQLRDFVERIKRFKDGRRAVHLHFSRLRPQNRRPQHLRIAANTIEDFIFTYEGQLFHLGNGDMVFIVKGADLMLIDESIMRLRTLFSEDPLSAIKSDIDGHGRFATMYSMEHQYEKFRELCEDMSVAASERDKRLGAMAHQAGENEEVEQPPLTPQQLGQLEEVLRRTDLTSVFKRQPICVLSNNSEQPNPVFNELYISIPSLAKTILPDANLGANRWLFQHLTQTLDRRVLSMLSKTDDSTLYGNFSINLNVKTLLSQEFMTFDSNLRTGSRGSLLIEMQLVDIMSDFSNFLFARDFVKDKGYRICLDGVNADLLSFIDRKKLGIDLIKLNSGPIFNGETTEEKFEEVAETVDEIGKGRIILSRCDNKLMVENGQKMGITLFQGHYLDKLMARLSREKNPPPPEIHRTRRFT